MLPDSKPASGLAGFWQELKRLKVMRVAITYIVLGEEDKALEILGNTVQLPSQVFIGANSTSGSYLIDLEAIRALMRCCKIEMNG